MPFGPFSAEHAKIATYVGHPGNAFRLPKSSNLKRAQRKEYNNLHALTCPFAEFSLLHIVDFIIKTIKIAHIQPIKCKYSEDLHKATKGCSAVHILPHTCSQALAKYFCTLLPIEGSNAPVMVNN